MASKIRKQLLGSSTIEDVSPYLIARSCGVDAAEPLRQLDKTGQVIDVAEKDRVWRAAISFSKEAIGASQLTSAFLKGQSRGRSFYFLGGSTGKSSARSPMTAIIRQRRMTFSMAERRPSRRMECTLEHTLGLGKLL